jgi:hypothetical protein
MDTSEIPVALLYDYPEVAYTREQLRPTIERLTLALDVDLAAGSAPQQRLAAAWTRIAELRFPRKAVPQQVLDAIEDLVLRWSREGIAQCAAKLTNDEVQLEEKAIAWMRDVCVAASEDSPEFESARTD